MDEIDKFKEKLASKGLQGLALDIDETLADSNYHWFEYMLRFYALPGMNVQSAVKAYKFVEQVPEWRTKEAFDHMQKLLHSEEFNEGVPLIEDANHSVNKINKIIPILVYITARPQTIVDATVRWLKKHNFPDVELITRHANIKASETDLQDRNKWKAEILVRLYPEIQGIVDDNKVLAHELMKLDYQGTLYLYGKETDEFKEYKHVVVCPTWGSVFDKIKQSV